MVHIGSVVFLLIKHLENEKKNIDYGDTRAFYKFEHACYVYIRTYKYKPILQTHIYIRQGIEGICF